MSRLVILPHRFGEELCKGGQVDFALILDDVTEARGHMKC